MRTDPNLAAYREYVRFCRQIWHCPPASFEVWALIHKFGHVPTMAK